jgi:hypothetical protein
MKRSAWFPADFHFVGALHVVQRRRPERRALEVDLDLARSEVEVTRQAIRLYRSLGGGWEHSIRTLRTEIATKPGAMRAGRGQPMGLAAAPSAAK